MHFTKSYIFALVWPSKCQNLPFQFLNMTEPQSLWKSRLTVTIREYLSAGLLPTNEVPFFH